MYTTINFKTKKALKEAIAAGRQVGIYQPGPFGGREPTEGTVFLEGPHYPAPHTWYGTGTLKGGYLTKVKNPRKRSRKRSQKSSLIPLLLLGGVIYLLVR